MFAIDETKNFEKEVISHDSYISELEWFKKLFKLIEPLKKLDHHREKNFEGNILNMSIESGQIDAIQIVYQKGNEDEVKEIIINTPYLSIQVFNNSSLIYYSLAIRGEVILDIYSKTYQQYKRFNSSIIILLIEKTKCELNNLLEC